ncbi:hypothetical protein [Poseidonibacter sp.]|uniref:hypothetical protein n=1 Tax=Poseidonibacter sp. TaxID=2321188 RepID=UPI003C77B7A1
MTNTQTIQKLNEALNTLIKAYEELQNDNTNLKVRINELEDEVLDLESTKEDLEYNVKEFKTSTEADNSNINSMLGKIEGLLNNKVNSTNSNSNNSSEKPQNNSNGSFNSQSDIKVEEQKKEDENSNKIDLNRMASLLNGFNN